jgi:hypothetical protein
MEAGSRAWPKIRNLAWKLKKTDLDELKSQYRRRKIKAGLFPTLLCAIHLERAQIHTLTFPSRPRNPECGLTLAALTISVRGEQI